jgi:protein-arginine kinase activator protein McsA
MTKEKYNIKKKRSGRTSKNEESLEELKRKIKQQKNALTKIIKNIQNEEKIEK